MRLITCVVNGVEQVGISSQGRIFESGYSGMGDVIADGTQGLANLREALERGVPVEGATVIAPHPHPGKLLFCGRNYSDHVSENRNATRPAHPTMFSKLPSAIIGPNEDIVLPRDDLQPDYEVELALIMGRRARNVSVETALDYVFGYTLVNDVSARAIQFDNHQLVLGKGLDTFCPMGPEIVLVDELPDPATLTITAHVNGEERQRAHTSEMIFTPAEIIAFYSSLVTLEPGDLVSTGTPGGVGCFHDPPLYLQPGDEVTVAADGIGQLSNPVRAGW